MSNERFNFASGNLQKILAVPKYLLAMLIAVFVPRDFERWVFGSGIGVGEGALAVARALRDDHPAARIVWLVADDAEAELALAEGFYAVPRIGRAGFWETLRAGHVIVTHGLGDANRFGVFGARIVHLMHGAPLKRLHLDSPITTQTTAPRPLRVLLQRMYAVASRQVTLYVAGSFTAAQRLRSAYRVDPGRVRILGDPRDDALCQKAADPRAAEAAKAQLIEVLSSVAEVRQDEPFVLYVPTWRDGAADPAAPSDEEASMILAALEALGARLLIRSHPLGSGSYEALLQKGGDRVQLLGSDIVRDITPLLGAFAAVITDYSSLAIDYALLGRPIVWFAPDLEEYQASRGLYEPLAVTAASHVQRDWQAAMTRLTAVLTPGSPQQLSATADTRALASRFHAYPEGGAARRVLAAIRDLALSDAERVPDTAVFFESYYGKQASCNPLALDREIAKRLPQLPRYWSVAHEQVAVPEGAVPVLVGSPEWFAVRRRAQLLIVNDWLRYGFRRRAGQTVLQTWHGTMLKHLALGRPRPSLRTRLAVHRESRRWSLLLSQNPHASEQFRRSYAFRGEILELGYPRDDRLAAAVLPAAAPGGGGRIDISVQQAKRVLGIAPGERVLAYIPTWRAGGGHVDTLDVAALAGELGAEWVILARGHTRSHGNYGVPARQDMAAARVLDVSAHPDVNDVILAADLLVTDYSSVMFDAAVAKVPMAFFVPDLAAYRDRERGFTFDFAASAPGPLLTSRAEVVAVVQAGVPIGEAYARWCERFLPHEDGYAAVRVVDALLDRGALVG